MPIRPENRKLYAPDWKQISLRIRERGGNRCEGSPKYPDCRAENGQPHPVTGSRVVLTTAHLDHDPRNNLPGNLKSLCQKCHNSHDAAHRAAGVKERRWKARGQTGLPLEPR